VVKKIITGVMVFSLMLTLPAYSGAAEKQVIKKKTEKVLIKENQKKKIVLSKKVLKKLKKTGKKITVKVSGKEYVKVSKKVFKKKKGSFVIKGIAEGKAKVTVKSGKVKYKLKVVVEKKLGNENVVPTNVPSAQPSIVPTATPVPEPTVRPFRTRITVPESEPETKDGYTKLTDLTTYSINGEYAVNIWNDSNSAYYYNVVCGGKEVIEISPLGLTLSGTDLVSGVACDNAGSYVDELYEEYETLTLADATAINNCQERTIAFSNADGASYKLLVRVYDDGVAYKYTDVTYGTGETVKCTEEASAIVFPEGTTTWGGRSGINTAEYDFNEMPYNRFVNGQNEYQTPFLANIGDYWMVVSEAQIYNNNGEFCKSRLAKSSGSRELRWDFGDARDERIPLEQQAKNQNTNLDLVNVAQIGITEVETVNGFSTPWRAMVISDDFDEFCTSKLISNLNPPTSESKYADVYEDTSWIKPGKVLWSWWADGNYQGDYNLHKNSIDMAAEYGFDYICLDVGWRSFENRLKELCDYAETKGVKVFCWINYWEMTTPESMEALFSKWAEAGAVGVKTDYFEGEEQQVLNVMENVAVIGAKYHFMVLYHGCIAPGGEYRTYPNVLTTEAVLGEENRKWSNSPSSEGCLMYPFSRNILGSMDYTPACKDIRANNNETEGFAIAKAVVYESGLLHLAASAKEYRDYVGLPFLQSLYTTWDESFIPAGEAYPGKHITYVRRHDEEWFIGSMTIDPKTTTVDLGFLDAGEYTASIYSAVNGKLVANEKTVTYLDSLTFELGSKDGVVVYIRKK